MDSPLTPDSVIFNPGMISITAFINYHLWTNYQISFKTSHLANTFISLFKSQLLLSEKDVKKYMEAYLAKWTPVMDKVISGECTLPTFGSTDIPSIDDFPSLLLHKLGEFPKEVAQRISKVFIKKTVYVFSSVIVFELQVDLLT